jgi:cytosine/adenosine deaminase-related metal-dependent hydrolase
MLILHNLHIINENVKDISVDKGLIRFTAAEARAEEAVQHLYFENCIAFAGLINSHDHLDFDLFPRLGNRIYNDYVEWGRDIHAVNKPAINEVLQVPRHLRVKWGVYKNLLAGVTTVVHHGHYVDDIPDAPIRVFQDCNMLHSIQLEKKWRLKLNNPFADKRPWVVHIGEGTNVTARKEIDSLIRWNILGRKLIGVHGIALDPRQARSLEALIWCPDSNFFLIGATADITRLKAVTKIVFGTDSTVSASWNIWEQLRLARKTGLLTDVELFQSLTTVPAGLWNIRNTGALKAGMNADIVVAKQKGAEGRLDAFFRLDPEDIQLVLKQGKIVLFDKLLLQQLDFNEDRLKGYSTINLNGVCKYVAGDLPALVKAIRQYAPGLELPFEK